MRSFKDTEGRVWTVSVNVAAVKRVRALCGVDLASAIEATPDGGISAGTLSRLAADPVLLVDVLYALAKDEAEKRGVGDEEFGRAMAGDALDAAAKALIEEIVDFFPNPKRALLKKVAEAAERFGAETQKALEQVLAEPGFDAKVDEELRKSTGWSAPSRESPA